ncbi:preprotein translocase subunit SecE [Cutibacterium sp. WCA-380-WT-3A]|uniref:Protein translocase subunit SecE n=1 Tax=Cutibacterium porci TaxID=2605781 RepID=A0A7K0J8Q8_9ACTN|nr:preprotein translocase subunit SecE [Cutibacterium porci]MSS46138.1 preprotein translocase subunit SecE [Cutibacterium porci]
MTDEKRNLNDGDDPSVEGELSPRGEDLASNNLPETGEYDVVDPEAEELTTPDDVVDKTPDKADPEDMVIDDPDQLEEAEHAAASARSTRPVRKKDSASKPARRGKPVRKQGDAASQKSDTASESANTKPKRELTKAPVRKAKSQHKPVDQGKRHVGPVTFTKQSVAELRKVKWPTGDELGQYFLVVLVFVLLIIAYVSGLDVVFGWLVIKLFGN